MAELSPISLASTILGFIGFILTLATLIRVTWTNFMSLVTAPANIRYTLANLKQALFEERMYLRAHTRLRHPFHQRMSQATRVRFAQTFPELSGLPSERILLDDIKKLCRDFRQLEAPFLAQQGGGALRAMEEAHASSGRHARGRAHAPGEGKDRYWDGWEERDDEKGSSAAGPYAWKAGQTPPGVRVGFESEYAERFTLVHRFIWLFRQGSVDDLWTNLRRIQIRRIGRETAVDVVCVRTMQTELEDLQLIGRPRANGRGAPLRRGHADVNDTGGLGRRRRSSMARSVRSDGSFRSGRSYSDASEERVHVRRSIRER